VATYGYDVFISCSHAADSPLADALENGIHRFGKPIFNPRGMWASWHVQNSTSIQELKELSDGSSIEVVLHRIGTVKTDAFNPKRLECCAVTKVVEDEGLPRVCSFLTRGEMMNSPQQFRKTRQ
jgi:hypothetical protein